MSSTQVEYELGIVEQFARDVVAFTHFSLSRKNPVLLTSASVDALADNIASILSFKDTRYVVVTSSSESVIRSHSPSLYTFEGYGLGRGMHQWTALFNGNTFYLSLDRDHFIQTTVKQLDDLVTSLSEVLCTKQSHYPPPIYPN